MWVRVARVGKPFGVRGLVTVQVFTDSPAERLVAGGPFALSDDGGNPVSVTKVQRMGTRWVLGFAGVADRNQAEAMRGAELFAPADGVSPAAEEWFDWQLVGRACEGPAGEPLGEVVAVEHPPAQDLLVVRTPAGRTVRVPFVTALVPRIGDHVVTLDPPGGLFDEVTDL